MRCKDAPHDIPDHWMPAVAELSRRVAAGDPGYRDAFEVLATRRFFADVAIPQLMTLCASHDHTLPRSRSAQGGWAVYGDQRITLSFSIVSVADDAEVDTPLTDTSLAVVGPGCVTFERYRTTVPDHLRDVFSPDHLLADDGVVELTEGRALHMAAERDIVRIAACDRPTPVLTLVTRRGSARLCWHYDAVTRRPIGASYADNESSQTRFLINAIVEGHRVDLIDFVEDSVRHAVHAVRWTAVKALWALDAERALRATLLCLDDPHPHVRNAAATTLRMYEAQKSQGERACL